MAQIRSGAVADKERINKLLADAKKLEKEDRLVEAGDAAQKILAIQANHPEAKALVAELQPKIAAAKAAEAYFPMIKLGEPKYSKPGFFGKGFARVSAKNIGDKAVKKVRVLYTVDRSAWPWGSRRDCKRPLAGATVQWITQSLRFSSCGSGPAESCMT